MQLHHLSGKNRKRKVVGRGGKRGTYSGRGVKGQKARSGHRIRPAIRDYIKQIPKLRGRGKHVFKSTRQKPHGINLALLEAHFNAGELVSPKSLFQKGLMGDFGGRFFKVKILGEGKLSKGLIVRKCTVSASAKAAIERAGGKIL